MSKWERFNSSYSPVIINKPNTAGGNLALDWLRESGQDRMTINGIPLKNFADKYNGFKEVANVKQFFHEVILKDFALQNDSQKEYIVDYLETAFHQGGMMYPVSGAFATSMKEYNEDFGEEVNYATVGDMDMKINIQTTTTGFKVQEITGVKNLLATPGTSGEEMANDIFSIEPDSGYDYVVKLQGTIDIDFSNSDNSPSITVENNGLSYGHSGIQSKVDSRHFGQKIVDFFKKCTWFK